MTACRRPGVGRGFLFRFVLWFATAVSLFGAAREFIPFATVKAILPAELRVTSEAHWIAWCHREDKAIRARLEQGDLDSLANLLLLGCK